MGIERALAGESQLAEEWFCHIAQCVAGQTDLLDLPQFVLPLSPWLCYLSAPDSLPHLRHDCRQELYVAEMVALAHPVPYLVDNPPRSVALHHLEVAHLEVARCTLAYLHRSPHNDEHFGGVVFLDLLLRRHLLRRQPDLHSDLQVPLLAHPELS